MKTIQLNLDGMTELTTNEARIVDGGFTLFGFNNCVNNISLVIQGVGFIVGLFNQNAGNTISSIGSAVGAVGRVIRGGSSNPSNAPGEQ